ncbi:MAG: hypothetical protein ACRC6V_01465 [Bacteroidales bacterium]
MIKMNSSLRIKAGLYYERLMATRRVLWVFSGPKPTKEQIASLVTNGVILSNSIKSLGTLRLSAVYEPTVGLVQVNQNLQSWPLGSANIDFTVHSPGEAHWFAFMMCATSINSPSFSVNADTFQAYIGSVGDIGSGSEMELLTGIIETDRIYKASDFDIRIG